MTTLSNDDKRKQLMAQITKAAGEGDLAQVAKLGAEVGKLQRDVQAVEAEAQRGAREAYTKALTTALATLKVPTSATITGTLRRSESGMDDLVIAVSAEVADPFWGAYRSTEMVNGVEVSQDKFPAPSTVKAVRFTVANGKATVEIGAPPKGGGGGGQSGKGYKLGEGESLALAKAFDVAATQAEKAEYAKLTGGNAQYTFKKQVVEKAGYKQNGN